jgi:hypothetical protein
MPQRSAPFSRLLLLRRRVRENRRQLKTLRRVKQGGAAPPITRLELTSLGIAEQARKRDIGPVFPTRGLTGFWAAATGPLPLCAAFVPLLLRSEIPHGHHHQRKT